LLPEFFLQHFLAAFSCLQLLKPRLPLQRGINRRTRGRRLGR
jgi:hypothetical protein